MDPKIWGNGVWFLIFRVFFRFSFKESDTKEVKDKKLSLLKKILHDICISLPCDECREHAIKNITKNKILESKDLYQILFFFIELRNSFQTNDMFIINIKDLDKNLTLRTKALIFRSFCLEFLELNTNDIEELKNIKNKIDELISKKYDIVI